jgi:hypothetical protein
MARIAVTLLVLEKVPGSVPISRSLMLTVQCLSACLVLFKASMFRSELCILSLVRPTSSRVIPQVNAIASLAT